VVEGDAITPGMNVIPGHPSANEDPGCLDGAHRAVDNGLPDLEKVVRRLDQAPAVRSEEVT